MLAVPKSLGGSQPEIMRQRVGMKRAFEGLHVACDPSCLGKRQKMLDYTRAAAKIQNKWKAVRTKWLYYRYLWLLRVRGFRDVNPDVAEFNS